ncbi:MAG: lysophospholipid acyltransferase family protein [Desulfurobacteriaceae bacterium]
MKLSKVDFLFVLIKLWGLTLRKEVRFQVKPQFPAIFAFWHGRIFALPVAFSGYGGKVAVLISRHRDGQLAASLVEKFGFRTVRGSTGKGKGGEKAFFEMVNLLKSGISVALTPDGPRGPREKVKPGIVKLSKVTQLPIYPISFSAKGIRLNSWDRFLLPYPFSKTVIIVGEPLEPSLFDSEEEMAEELESRLISLTRACDMEVGWKGQ